MSLIDFDAIIDGGMEEAAVISVITEAVISPAEIISAASAMRKRAVSFSAPAGTMDCCGTGGDNSNSLNVSTAVAFVVAACGVKIAKHGNRAVTSKSGSTDVLSALGVRTDVEPEIMEHALHSANLAFLAAPLYHPSLARLAPIRKKIGRKTIFNLLGPLTNPANVKIHLLGVYDASLCRIMAEALKTLGSTAAWVVNGDGGIDEIAISGSTHIACLSNGEITEFTITPADAGLPLSPAEALTGGTPEHNAAAMLDLFSGVTTPYRDAVLLNSAAALVVAGKSNNLLHGVKLAAYAIDSGAAMEILEKIREISNE